LRRESLRRLAARTAEILEEFGVRTQQITRVVRLQAVLIGRHRAIEGEEVGILAIGFGEQTVALGVAGTADLLRRRIRFRDDHRALAIRLGADLLRLLAALGTEFRGL